MKFFLAALFVFPFVSSVVFAEDSICAFDAGLIGIKIINHYRSSVGDNELIFDDIKSGKVNVSFLGVGDMQGCSKYNVTDSKVTVNLCLSNSSIDYACVIKSMAVNIDEGEGSN